MKVYCRFAPPPTDGCGASTTHRPVHLLVDEVRPAGACTQQGAPQRTVAGGAALQSLTVGDPITGSCASLTCHAVLLPHAVNNNQNHVFNTVALPMVEDVLAGKSCALLAYGQTCTGKTHTMFGPDGGNVRYFHSVDARGVVPRVAEALFARRSSCRVVAVDVCYFELYNETATDLVAKLVASNRENPDPPLAASLYAHRAADSGGRSASMGCKPRPTQALQVTYKPTEKQRLKRSLAHVTVTNGEDCLQVIGELSALRQVSSTESNIKSTRSHVVIQLHVHVATTADGRGTMGEQFHSGQLTLIDLAGSESLKAHQASMTMATSSDVLRRSAKSQTSSFEDASGILRSQQMQARQHEMKHINTSLFALKKVVHALTTKQEHVPVNESMLTVVLEGPLQSSSAALVVCCSTQHKDLQETLATMRLGSEATQIPPASTVASRMRVHAHHNYQEQQQQLLGRRLMLAQHRRADSMDDDDDDDVLDGNTAALSSSETAMHQQQHQQQQLRRPRHEAFHMDDVSLPEIAAPSDHRTSSTDTTIAIRTVGELLSAGVVGPTDEGEHLNAFESADRSTCHSSDLERCSRDTALSTAATVDAEQRREIRTLRHQCVRMAEAYDEAMEEVVRLRHALREKTEAVHRLELEASIVKNTQKLTTHQQQLQRQQQQRFPVLCEHIEPEEHGQADGTPSGPLVPRMPTPCPAPTHAFGNDITNTAGCHSTGSSEVGLAQCMSGDRCGEGPTVATDAVAQRRTRRPTVQIFTPSSERLMLIGVPQDGECLASQLPVTPMLRV